MPDFDMKMMPTFKDLPTLAEDRKTDELAHQEPTHFELAGQQWNQADWWRQMDQSDEELMYKLGAFAQTDRTENPINYVPEYLRRE